MCIAEWGHSQEVCGRLSVKVETNGWEVSAAEEAGWRQVERVR